jgi:hypothetical protein
MGATVSAGAGHQPGQRPRNRALCCECGQVRAVAQSYRGKKPKAVRAPVPGAAPWCTWLRCAHCDAVRLQAVIADTLAQQWRVDGCDRERHNRLTDRCRRRIERRLTALVAEGVTVVEVTTPGDMQIDDALVEVVEYDDARSLQIRICATATPVQLLRGLEDAEDVIDETTALGAWHHTTAGRWRGLALRA